MYEEIADEGHVRMRMNWVIVEIKNSKDIVKSRLTVRGKQGDKEGVRAESSTLKKGIK